MSNEDRLKLKIKNLERKLEFYRRNYVTGLLGRHDFFNFANSLLDNNENFYFYFIDVNNLHKINREQGMSVGDSILRSVADRLILINNLHVFHIGGDEFFAISLDEIDIRCNKASISCVYSKGFETIEDIIKEADRLLIEKKASLGRRCEDM